MAYKNIIFIGLILYNIIIKADAILVAVLMVKNEAPVMVKTLQPLVDAGITDYLIYDTGSTDDTIPITQDFFIKNNITNFVIKQGMWIDFASSRNQALQLAQQYFPEATFMLMLDAEWILHNGSDLLKFCYQCQNNPETLYLIQVKGLNIELSHPRLIRCRSNIHFVGKVHEAPNVQAQARVANNIYFELNPTDYGKIKSQTRWIQDRDLLIEELQKNPHDTRTIMFLAQTYFCLQDLPNAIKWYEYRTTLSGHDEENFLAHFCLAQAYQAVENIDKMVFHYLKAFELRPHRAEPLIKLAEHYYNTQNYYLSYLFAKYALTMPYPTQDTALIEPWLYNFVRYNLVSATAYMMQDFKLGKQATLAALQVCPDEQYLQENLKSYQRMLNEVEG